MKTLDDLGKGLATLQRKLESVDWLESTVSQVSKTLCGKENATLDDLLKAADQLKNRLAQVERERDAALYDMHQLQGATCAYCKNLYRPDGAEHVHCRVFGDLSRFSEDERYNPLMCGRFEWRGVCAENTKEEK